MALLAPPVLALPALLEDIRSLSHRELSDDELNGVNGGTLLTENDAIGYKSIEEKKQTGSNIVIGFNSLN